MLLLVSEELLLTDSWKIGYFNNPAGGVVEDEFGRITHMHSWEQALGTIVLAIMTQNRDLTSNTSNVNYMQINYQASGLQISRSL